LQEYVHLGWYGFYVVALGLSYFVADWLVA